MSMEAIKSLTYPLSLCSSFSGEPSPGSIIRYVETQSMQIGASYSLQFSLVMGCGREPSPHIDTQVRLEFSTNHGLTWHLVKEVRDKIQYCLPFKIPKLNITVCIFTRSLIIF